MIPELRTVQPITEAAPREKSDPPTPLPAVTL